MTASRVTYANLFSEAWNNIYQLIKSNATDPLMSSYEKRKWVYSDEPDVKASDFKGYPFIIVWPAELDIPEEEATVDGRSKRTQWTVEIEIVASDRGYGGKDGQGRSHLDSVSNSVMQVLMNITNRKTLRDNGLYKLVPAASGVTEEPLENEKVFRRTFVLSFRGKMQVTA